ncbi:hypothetical protein GM921_16415 [Pedobacter sp. LMG 31464]|uniref:DKNYY family protein n=1 Tax=Pedobacter planticolens TaxID=2679964 RepID=A0A923IVJ5_9SPHI|nr:hypothetical protein [Pedobacter planticolens]
MTTRLLLLAILATSLLISCKRGYKVENDKVYYEYWNEGSGQGKRFIEQADATTFQQMKFDCDCNLDFGKDKNHLFIDGEPIRDIDPNAFKFIGNYIFVDKDSAYFFGFYNNINDCSIKGIELDKLKLFEYPWSRAGNILIHGNDTLTLNDIDDFNAIDEDWGKTKKHVINDNKIVDGADPATFKVINSYSGRDKNNVYEFGKIKR